MQAKVCWSILILTNAKNHIYEKTTQAPLLSLASASLTTRTGVGMSGRNARGERRKRRKTHHSLLVRCFYPRQKRRRLCDRNISRTRLRGCKGTGHTTVVRGCGIGVEDLCAQELVLFNSWLVVRAVIVYYYKLLFVYIRTTV